MKKVYQLEDFRVLKGNSFSEKDVDLLYFSVEKDDNSPKSIKDKINSMITDIIHKYEKQQGCRLNIGQLEVEANLMVSLANREHKPESFIDITISSCEADKKGILIYDEFIVEHGTELFELFKNHFMNQLELVLFGNLAS